MPLIQIKSGAAARFGRSSQLRRIPDYCASVPGHIVRLTTTGAIMSLRFDRNVAPKWNGRHSWIEFSCEDPAARLPVRCAVSRAALEDCNGETLDPERCLAATARRLGRILEVANAVYAAGRTTRGMVLVDSDDLWPHTPSVH